MCRPLLDADGVTRLRSALTEHNYTSAGVAARLGPQATAAIARNDQRAAIRATADGDPLATLIRLFICARDVPTADVAAALHPLPIADALEAGLLAPAVEIDHLRAGIDLEPYGDGWWVLSDLAPDSRERRLQVDHVLGVGGASTTLVDATLRSPVTSALDLGTGCGVQALHLSQHAASVTATDVAPRALRFAATTAALAGLDWELLAGDMTKPVAGRRFDLVVSNPPFIVGPAGPARYVYRDSGRHGDALCADLAAAAPGLLTEGGTLQYLANWAHVTGESWQDRVAGWVTGTGLDAWVVQREVTDPLTYVNMWLADAAENDRLLAAEWLDWFDAHKVEAVGFGLVTLRRGGNDDPTVRVEELRQTYDGRLGDHVADWFGRQDWLRAHGGDLLGAHFRAAPGLRLHQEASLGDDGWAVDHQVLALADGLRRHENIDPLVLALVGGCDGALPLRTVIDMLAAAHEVEPHELTDVAVPLVARLVERGFITPAGAPGVAGAGAGAPGS